MAAGLAQAATPAVASAFDVVLERVAASRVDRARRTLSLSAAMTEADEALLVEAMAQHHRSLELLASSLDAASRSTAEMKIAVFARSIANGYLTSDEALVDIELEVVAAFRLLEAAHLRVLLCLAQPDARHPGFGRGMTIDELSHISGGSMCPTIRPIVATLEQAGLIAQHRELSSGWLPPHRGLLRRTVHGRAPMWSVTRFGRRCVARVETEPDRF